MFHNLLPILLTSIGASQPSSDCDQWTCISVKSLAKILSIVSDSGTRRNFLFQVQEILLCKQEHGKKAQHWPPSFTKMMTWIIHNHLESSTKVEVHYSYKTSAMKMFLQLKEFTFPLETSTANNACAKTVSGFV